MLKAAEEYYQVLQEAANLENGDQQRLEILKQTIEYWLNNKTDKTIEIIQLFYDFYFGGVDN